MTAFKNIAGQRFGKLVAIRRVENLPPYGQARWLFQCDCGKEHVAFGYTVLHLNVKSCGCAQHERHAQLRHGQTGTPEHYTWAAIRQRCENPKCRAYPHYGGRGIKVCDRWQTFENFYADMGARPEGMTLDRIDNDGDYAPDNCRWATTKQQVRNRRVSGSYMHNGQSMSLSEWAERMGLPYQTVWTRFRNGWRGEKLFSPLGPTSGKKKLALRGASAN